MAERRNVTLPVMNGGPSNKGRPLPLRDQPGTDPNHYEGKGNLGHPRPVKPRS